MKLGEIKAEALYLCFATPELCIDTEDSEALCQALGSLKYESDYSDYLNASVGAINRCLAYIELKGLAPERVARIPYDPKDLRDGVAVIKLNSLIEDFDTLVSVTEEGGGLISYVEYARTGDEIRLLPPVKGDCYVVTYRPKVKRITHATPEDYDIPLPRSICELIPYFVKGDIMRMDDPEEAEKSAEIFYKLSCEPKDRDDTAITQVRTVYGMV